MHTLIIKSLSPSLLPSLSHPLNSQECPPTPYPFPILCTSTLSSCFPFQISAYAECLWTRYHYHKLLHCTRAAYIVAVNALVGARAFNINSKKWCLQHHFRKGLLYMYYDTLFYLSLLPHNHCCMNSIQQWYEAIM